MEFALVIPLVLVALLGVVQITLIAQAQLEAIHLARELARAAAVDANPDIERLIAAVSIRDAADWVVDIDVEPGAVAGRDLVHVEVVLHTMPTVAPFDGLSRYVEVRAEATMFREF